MTCYFTGPSEPMIHSERSNDSLSTVENSGNSSAHETRENRVKQPPEVHVSEPNSKTRDCGHRAGFDAFMTGYCMGTYLLQLDKRNEESELALSSLVEIANRLSLTKKDVPLHITRSHFTRPSPSHSEKLKRLKERVSHVVDD